jgi:hypothetical protein
MDESGAPPPGGFWPYLGVGCLTAVVGVAGGGMIAVLVAKVVGAFQGCAAAPDTGAPCHWGTYAVVGMGIGLITVPSIAMWRLRRARAPLGNTE